MEPPDPIPNSEVKRTRADGSVRSPHVRVGHCQAFKYLKGLQAIAAPFLWHEIKVAGLAVTLRLVSLRDPDRVLSPHARCYQAFNTQTLRCASSGGFFIGQRGGRK